MDKIENLLKKIKDIVANITEDEIKNEIHSFEEKQLLKDMKIEIVFPKELKVNITEKYVLKVENNYNIVPANVECDFVEEEKWKMLKAV